MPFLLALLLAAAAAAAPPDLRLEWSAGAGPVDAEAGQTLELPYVLRNVGGSDAFAAIVRVTSSLGASGQPARLQPGRKAGETLQRKLTFAAATGVREVCVEVTLQNRNRDDALDPTLSDNRICRVLRVSPRKKSAEVSE